MLGLANNGLSLTKSTPRFYFLLLAVERLKILLLRIYFMRAHWYPCVCQCAVRPPVHACLHAGMLPCVYLSVCLCAYVRSDSRASLYTYVLIRVHGCECVSVCACICVYVYLCVQDKNKTRKCVYETLCPNHVLVHNDDLNR